MPPRMITGLHIPRRAAHAHIDLIIHRARPRLQFPVQRPRSHIESARVEEEEGAAVCGDGGELGEADVVADG